MVERDFGSARVMLEEIGSESAGHFGSGWVWLVLKNGKLKLTSCHDADTPVVRALVPLSTLDVWELAYYIDIATSGRNLPRRCSTVSSIGILLRVTSTGLGSPPLTSSHCARRHLIVGEVSAFHS